MADKSPGFATRATTRPFRFHNANDRNLFRAPFALVGLVFGAPITLAGLASDIGFVGLDNAVQETFLIRIGGHRGANALHHAPDSRAARTVSRAI
nr:hypothetical protein [Mesorhizobium sp.]